MKKLLATGLLLGSAALAAALATAEVTRHPLPGSDFPIAQAVEVTAGTTIVYHSGMTPRPAKPDAERYSEEFWGDSVGVRSTRRVSQSQRARLRRRAENADISGRCATTGRSEGLSGHEARLSHILRYPSTTQSASPLGVPGGRPCRTRHAGGDRSHSRQTLAAC